MKRFATVLAIAGLCAPLGAMAGTRCADLALVLAVDSSSSIDEAEFKAQVQGYAAAFADPVVLGALRDAGTVDVAAVLWSDSAIPERIVGWQRIDSDDTAMDVAESFAALDRQSAGDTDLGNGLSVALDLLTDPGRCHSRAVVNVSGDGRASVHTRRHAGVSVSEARARASAMGVTVNALAILNAEPSLGEYFRASLITGPDSFVMESVDFATFREVLVQKLEREIRPQLSAALDTAQPARHRSE